MKVGKGALEVPVARDDEGAFEAFAPQDAGAGASVLGGRQGIRFEPGGLGIDLELQEAISHDDGFDVAAPTTSSGAQDDGREPVAPGGGCTLDPAQQGCPGLAVRLDASSEDDDRNTVTCHGGSPGRILTAVAPAAAKN